MLLEADLIVKRAALRWLAQRHPSWTHQELAVALHMSRSWVSKWLQRLRQADPRDVMACHSRSRARHTPPASIASQPAVVEPILEIGIAPPENLHRVPGPEAILSYLRRDPTLKAAGVRLPRSQTPIWKILRQAGCIPEDRRRKPQPLERRQPGEEVQFALKEASSVPPDPEGKQQHLVEIANVVDAGTSIWLHRAVGADFDAEILLAVVAQFLREHGRPHMLTFANDPRFVGSPSGRDFPAALVRLLFCLGVEPNVIPPHRPDLNAYVERFHRTLSQECLQVHRPDTHQQVQETTEAFLIHYHDERPNQARSCGKQPPRVACPQFPRLPAVPERVDADRWLRRVHQQTFARTVQAEGSVRIDHRKYYVGRAWAGQRVACVVQAPCQHFDIWQGACRIKQLPIKGLHGGPPLPFEESVTLMKQQARWAYRRYLQTHPRWKQGRLWA